MNGQSEADAIKEIELRDSSGGKKGMDDPQVEYMYSDQGPFMCSNCAYFQQPNACVKVEGEIDPEGCCNLFENAQSGEIEDEGLEEEGDIQLQGLA